MDIQKLVGELERGYAQFKVFESALEVCKAIQEAENYSRELKDQQDKLVAEMTPMQEKFNAEIIELSDAKASMEAEKTKAQERLESEYNVRSMELEGKLSDLRSKIAGSEDELYAF